MKNRLLLALALALSSPVCVQALLFDHYHDDEYYDNDYDDYHHHHGIVSGTVHAADDVADAGLNVATLGGWHHRHDRRYRTRNDNDNNND